MKTELFYLALTTAFTGVLWIPYILDRIAVQGLIDAVGYPKNPKPQSRWAQQLMHAHRNAVENLVIFASLVLILNAMGISTATTALACVIYFWSRVVHAVSYMFSIPWVRTLSFFVAFAAQVVLTLAIFGH